MNPATPARPLRTPLPLLLLALLVAALVPAAPAAAVPVDVPVANAGFEADLLREEGSVRHTITGWQTSSGGGDGIFRPTAGDYPGGIPDGRNVAYANLPGNSVRQVLTTPLQAETEYVLRVEVGWNNNDPFAGYIVQLRAGGTVLAEDDSTLQPAQGTFVTSTVRYTSGPADPEIGQPLEIWLLTPGIQANYDRVRLTADRLRVRVPCRDFTLPTDPGLCTASGSAIDDSALDPNGRATILSKDPPGPYPVGDTLVTLTVETIDGVGTCESLVTVDDGAAPVVECNALETIAPRETPVSFTATATDNCSVASVSVDALECWRINGAGKRMERTSCPASAAGDTMTIERSGGNGMHYAWEATATDGSGNAITRACGPVVVEAGNGGR